VAKDKLEPGTLIRVKPLPGVSVATFYEGKVGVIINAPKKGDIEYEIYVSEKSLWLIRGEIEPVQSKNQDKINQ
jgi:hypothetical protein